MTAFAREMRGAPGPSSLGTAGGERTPGRGLERPPPPPGQDMTKQSPAETHGSGTTDRITARYFLKIHLFNGQWNMIVSHSQRVDTSVHYFIFTEPHTHIEFAQGYAKFHLHTD